MDHCEQSKSPYDQNLSDHNTHRLWHSTEIWTPLAYRAGGAQDSSAEVLSRCWEDSSHPEQHSCVTTAQHRPQPLFLGSILPCIALESINPPVVKHQSEDLPHVLRNLWLRFSIIGVSLSKFFLFLFIHIRYLIFKIALKLQDDSCRVFKVMYN